MNNFELQAWLNEFGADLVVDGDAGPKTSQAAEAFMTRHGHNPRGSLLVAVEQLIMKIVGGLAVGPIDGVVGPATEKARVHWQRGPWRNTVLNALHGDERMPATLERWPVYSKLRDFFGEPGQNLTTISLPFPLQLAWSPKTQVHRVQCHKLVAESLVRVQQQILADYSYAGIVKLNLHMWGGCYNARPMRGSTKLSTHAWGIAWDTDPVRNALKMNRSQASLARPEYEKFWNAWTSEGWLSLGKARDFDWMHTQACRLG